MVILKGMKTAISISDSLFREADRLASRLGLSRSQLYARAVAEYLERHRDDEVTTRLDEVHARLGEGAALAPGLARAQAALLGPEEW